MKKKFFVIVALLLSLALVLAFSGCKNEKPADNNGKQTSGEISDNNEGDDDSNPDDDNNNPDDNDDSNNPDNSNQPNDDDNDNGPDNSEGSDKNDNSGTGDGQGLHIEPDDDNIDWGDIIGAN